MAKIQEAQKYLKPYLPPSPLVLNSWLSQLFGAEIYLKMENMQPIGSLKIRGAAWGSLKLGVNALIVMPVKAPQVKVQSTRALGAQVILYGNSFDESLEKAIQISTESGRVFVHAFDDDDVVAGQGTIGLEILEQLPDVDYLVGAVGGGGMMAGRWGGD